MVMCFLIICCYMVEEWEILLIMVKLEIWMNVFVYVVVNCFVNWC